MYKSIQQTICLRFNLCHFLIVREHNITLDIVRFSHCSFLEDRCYVLSTPVREKVHNIYMKIVGIE